MSDAAKEGERAERVGSLASLGDASDLTVSESSVQSDWGVAGSSLSSEAEQPAVVKVKKEVLTATVGGTTVGQDYLGFLLGMVGCHYRDLNFAGDEANRELQRRTDLLRRQEDKRVEEAERIAQLRRGLEEKEAQVREREAKLLADIQEFREIGEGHIQECQECLGQMKSWERRASAALRRLAAISFPS